MQFSHYQVLRKVCVPYAESADNSAVITCTHQWIKPHAKHDDGPKNCTYLWTRQRPSIVNSCLNLFHGITQITESVPEKIYWHNCGGMSVGFVVVVVFWWVEGVVDNNCWPSRVLGNSLQWTSGFRRCVDSEVIDLDLSLYVLVHVQSFNEQDEWFGD